MNEVYVVGLVETNSIRLVNTPIGPQPANGKMKLLWNYCLLALNVSMTTLTPEDQQIGSEKADGSWTGVIGMLQKNIVHIGFGSIVQTKGRFQVATFTSTFAHNQRKFLVGREPPVDIDAYLINFSFLEAMDNSLYLLFLGAILLLTFLSWFLNLGKPTKRPLYDHVWLVWEILMSKSSVFLPRYSAGRFLFSTWILGTLVVMNVYSGVLVSKFSFKSPPKFISTLSDFAKFPEVYPVLAKGKVDVEILKDSKTVIIKDLWKRVRKKLDWCIIKEAAIYKSSFTQKLLKRLENGRAALASTDKNFKKLLLQKEANSPCKFRTTDSYAFTYSSFLISRNLPRKIRKYINYRVSRISHTSLLDRVPGGTNGNLRYKHCFIEKTDDVSYVLDLGHLLGAIVIWLGVLGLATTIYFGEIVASIISKRNVKNRKPAYRQ